MRSLVLISLISVAACGGGGGATGGDAPGDSGGNNVPPRVLSGGGIADGPIDGVVNLYVIDDSSRTPISGANVQVGTVTGTTDATGLFTANGLTGAQTVLVQAAGHESAIWVAANGANITIDVKPTADPTPPSANISGAVDLSGITVGNIADHRTAVVVYSQDPLASDAVNNIATANSANVCDVTAATTTCDFTATVRTGKVALIAALYDHDLNGTPTNPADDIFTLKGWAGLTGLTVAAGVDQAGQNLASVATATESIAFGSPPGGLTTVEGIVGVELSDGSGVLQLPVAVPLATPMILAPALSSYTNATYAVTAIAENGTTDTSATSAQLLHGLSSATLNLNT